MRGLSEEERELLDMSVAPCDREDLPPTLHPVAWALHARGLTERWNCFCGANHGRLTALGRLAIQCDDLARKGWTP